VGEARAPQVAARPADAGRSTRPLRIAMLSYYLPSGSKIGVGFQAHELATELARRGHHVDMFSDCPPVEGALYGHRDVHMTGSLRTFRFASALRTPTTTGCGAAGRRCTSAPCTAPASRRPGTSAGSRSGRACCCSA
jgi:hypothetical protein